MMIEKTGYLPGLEPPAPEPGDVESGVRRQIEKLREMEVITDAHAGWVAHAIATARDVDNSAAVGRPSGRAALRDTLTKILESMPEAETVETTSLDRALAAITGGE